MIDRSARRALFVIASARRRGAEIQATQLAPRLAPFGWDVDVASLHAGTDGTRLDVSVLGRRRLGPSTVWALRRRARDHDIVVAYGSATLPACGIALAGTGVPFLYRSISDPVHWLRGPVHRRLTRLQYRQPAGIVALWPGAARGLVDELGVDPERITIIPNARNPDEFRPPTDAQRTAARTRFGLGGERVVAFVGAASPEKRLDLAVDVVARIPDHVLLVAGGGAGLADARTRARARLGDRAVFLGEVDDVRPVLHASDVVLLTSDVEGMPGVAIEAALCGVPVVATPVGAVESMGWIETCAAEPDLLAEAVRLAVEPADPEVAAGYIWPHVADQWAAHLDEQLRSTRPASGSGTLSRVARSSRWRPS